MSEKKERLGYASSDETKTTDDEGGTDRYYREPPTDSTLWYLLFGIILFVMTVLTAAFYFRR